MRGVTIFLALWLSATIHFVLPVVAEAALPPQLRGKSVVVSWSEERMQRPLGEGPLRQVTRYGEFWVYVSSAGRVFNRLRMSASSRRGFRSGDSDQGGDTASDRRTRSVNFQGRSLMVTTTQTGGARRITVNFDQDFGSCSAQVIRAKEVGASKMIGQSLIRPGQLTEIHSVRAGAASCSVRSGNVFGGE